MTDLRVSKYALDSLSLRKVIGPQSKLRSSELTFGGLLRIKVKLCMCIHKLLLLTPHIVYDNPPYLLNNPSGNGIVPLAKVSTKAIINLSSCFPFIE
jgi:hypothetical protein